MLATTYVPLSVSARTHFPIKLLLLSYRGTNSNKQRTILTSVLQSKKTQKTVNRKLVIHKPSHKRQFDRAFTTHTGVIRLCSSQLQTKDGETFYVTFLSQLLEFFHSLAVDKNSCWFLGRIDRRNKNNTKHQHNERILDRCFNRKSLFALHLHSGATVSQPADVKRKQGVASLQT